MSDIRIYAKTIEESARQQIEQFASLDAFKDSKIRIMPDVHAGAGCVIGFTADLGDKVIPNVVGVDIGCGMLAANIGSADIDLQQLDNVIKTYIPSGCFVHTGYYRHFPIQGWANKIIKQLKCYDRLKNIGWLEHSMGTLGGGNHFIEVDIDEITGDKWIVIHSGSRNLGKQVAEIYQDIAIKKCNNLKDEIEKLVSEYKAQGKKQEIANAITTLKSQKPHIPKSLCYLEGKEKDDYLHDMRLCQQFAQCNRISIYDIIRTEYAFREHNDIGRTYKEDFETLHNYIDNNNIVRKGAISAKKGERLLIPINMRDGCILGVGKGNEDWNCSAPHGAGRLMSRTQAKDSLTVKEYRESMDGIYTSSICYETLDEAPQAYKPLNEITELITPTVDIISILKPIYNFKAKE